MGMHERKRKIWESISEGYISGKWKESVLGVIETENIFGHN